MPSPISADRLLRNLIAGKKFTDDDILGAVENRRKVLTNCFGSFTLSNLGELMCLNANGLSHSLKKDQPTVHSDQGKFSLRTQGVFAGLPFARRVSAEKTYTTFGIARSGEWLSIQVDFTRILPVGGGYYEKALAVRVAEVDLPTLLRDTGNVPSGVWMFLDFVVDDWVQKRFRLYQDALAVQRGFKEEDAIFRILTSHSQ